MTSTMLADDDLHSSGHDEVALRTITSCEVCGGQNLQPVIDLGLHAMCDDLVAVGDSRTCARYPIEILFCATCLTAHQKYQVPKAALFPRDYHYRARLTADVLDGMRKLVASIEEHDGAVARLRVLDIGCNDGSLLSLFAERGALTHGIEPTDAALDAHSRGHQVTQAYFGPDVARAFVAEHGQPDVITFTNVFAHIERLDEVLGALRTLMGTHTRLVIENHYLGAVIARNQFDTFYHEHPRTYSRRSFEFVAQSLGCKLSRVEFPSRYGGNIRVVMSRDGAGAADDVFGGVSTNESHLGIGLQAMAERVANWRVAMRSTIDSLVAEHGPIRAKAFPGRAAIIVELLQLDAAQVSAVYEQAASPKLGHYVPGTRIPIISDAEFDLADTTPVLNFAWHIHLEIEGYMRRLGFAGRMVPVIPPTGG
ncbi:MAG: class I SAM-dependent methyltransferase [Gemmatimonadota bacterium]